MKLRHSWFFFSSYFYSLRSYIYLLEHINTGSERHQIKMLHTSSFDLCEGWDNAHVLKSKQGATYPGAFDIEVLSTMQWSNIRRCNGSRIIRIKMYLFYLI